MLNETIISSHLQGTQHQILLFSNIYFFYLYEIILNVIWLWSILFIIDWKNLGYILFIFPCLSNHWLLLSFKYILDGLKYSYYYGLNRLLCVHNGIMMTWMIMMLCNFLYVSIDVKCCLNLNGDIVIYVGEISENCAMWVWIMWICVVNNMYFVEISIVSYMWIEITRSLVDDSAIFGEWLRPTRERGLYYG